MKVYGYLTFTDNSERTEKNIKGTVKLWSNLSVLCTCTCGCLKAAKKETVGKILHASIFAFSQRVATSFPFTLFVYNCHSLSRWIEQMKSEFQSKFAALVFQFE